MNHKYLLRSLMIAAVLALNSIGTPVRAATMYGSLGNFDVINDTGQIAHGL